MVQVVSDERVRDDEQHRFTELARKFYDPVFAFIARQSPNQADAADLTQQTFIQAHRNFSRYDPQRDFAPWIYTIARRCVADFYRRRGRTLEQLDDSWADSRPDPRAIVSRHESQANIWDLARSLKPKFHQVLLLHYKEDFNLRETAEIMGVTQTHAKVLLFRARAALKRQMEITSTPRG